MRKKTRTQLGLVVAAGLLSLAAATGAQQRRTLPAQRASAYDLSREMVLQGTVLKFTENSAVPPLGARVTLQTASGPVDVHLGPARFLKLNSFTITEGSSLRVVGQNVSFRQGTMFFARIIQQGNQSLAVRSEKGMPLAPAGARALTGAQRAQLSRQEGAR